MLRISCRVGPNQASERAKPIGYPFISTVVHHVDVRFLNRPWRMPGITALERHLQRHPCFWNGSKCDLLAGQSAKANCMTTNPTKFSTFRIFQSEPVVVAVYKYFEHWNSP